MGLRFGNEEHGVQERVLRGTLSGFEFRASIFYFLFSSFCDAGCKVRGPGSRDQGSGFRA